MTNKQRTDAVGKVLVIALLMVLNLAFDSVCAQNKQKQKLWTMNFGLDTCSFVSTGKTTYFVLEPGYRLTLQGKEDNKTVELVITVLNETKKIGNIETRVVEERETVEGKLTEVSRNYFAICMRTNNIFYFGEDVDVYKNGKIDNHDGTWHAYSNHARPGLMMPGTVLLGARYYQEIAPNIAMDKAEIKSATETFDIPAGKFKNCLKVEERSDLEPKNKEYKFYAPGVGLIRDGDLRLIKYGFVE